MAYWDYKQGKVVHFPDVPDSEHEGWIWRDCGCCAGTEWGGDTPRECSHCLGQGDYYVHVKSGRIAVYPGGPFLGRLPQGEMQ